VETGQGRNADISYTIIPTFDIDPLLLVGRAESWKIDVEANTNYTWVTVPSGEFWHLKFMTRWDTVGGDWDVRVSLSLPAYDDPLLSTSNSTIVPFEAVSVAYRVTDVRHVTLRPNDSLVGSSSNFVTGGDAWMALSFDLEDCSS